MTPDEPWVLIRRVFTMTTHKTDNANGGQESQCYFVQLQIDSFLDGDLGEAQQDVFLNHVRGCSACSNELQFARLVHDTVLDLPLLDCSDAALEPIDRLGSTGDNRGVTDRPDWRALISGWFEQIPLTVRYALPAVFAVAVTLLLVQPTRESAAPETMLADQSTAVEPEYTQADVVAALADLNTAINYLNEVSQRTETMIGGRFVVMPLQESLNASFERIQEVESDSLADDSIF